MKKILLIAQCLALILASCFAACCPWQYDTESVLSYKLSFTINDKETKTNLISFRNGPYNPLLMRITDLQGKELDKNNFGIGISEGFTFRYIESDTTWNREITNYALIKFHDLAGNIGEGDVDTVKYTYSLTFNECEYVELTKLKVYFNDSLYFSDSKHDHKIIKFFK